MMRKYVLEPLGRLLRNPSFLVCTLVLAVGAGGLHAGGRWMQWHFRKLEVPLRKSLDDIDESKLVSYRVVQKSKIENKEVEEELGTTNYIQWVLEDTEAEQSDPTRFAILFVTYYTGNPDKIPHVPDWCYVGGGGVVEKKGNTKIKVPGIGLASREDELPVRVLEVLASGGIIGRQKRIVTYFFSVNGKYACTRTDVRLIQNNWRDKFAYFSKVEITFAGEKAITPEQSLAAVEKLCRVVVPVLWSEHWPDWSALP
jgi:hypothetical protein